MGSCLCTRMRDPPRSQRRSVTRTATREVHARTRTAQLRALVLAEHSRCVGHAVPGRVKVSETVASAIGGERSSIPCGVVRVIDGDTVEVLLELGHSLAPETLFTAVCPLRLAGIDAPETRTRDAAEKAAGLRVKNALRMLLTTHGAAWALSTGITGAAGQDKFGRLLGDLAPWNVRAAKLIAPSRSVSEWLLARFHGVVVVYDGRERKPAFSSRSGGASSSSRAPPHFLLEQPSPIPPIPPQPRLPVPPCPKLPLPPHPHPNLSPPPPPHPHPHPHPHSHPPPG